MRVNLIKATCGHPLPALPESGGTGYARTASGDVLCYPCSDALDRADMAGSDVHLAYLAGDGRDIVTWPGGTLARVTSLTSSRTGWHGSEVYAVSAVAPDGSAWYGRNGGPGMVIRLRRAAGTVTIGDRTRDGLLEVTDTNRRADGAVLVTVRELIGAGCWDKGLPVERMRSLARRAVADAGSARVVRRWAAQGSDHVTFAVSSR